MQPMGKWEQLGLFVIAVLLVVVGVESFMRPNDDTQAPFFEGKKGYEVSRIWFPPDMTPDHAGYDGTRIAHYLWPDGDVDPTMLDMRQVADRLEEIQRRINLIERVRRAMQER